MKTYANIVANLHMEFIFEWKFKGNKTKFISIAKDEKEVINDNSKKYGVDKNAIEIISCTTIERSIYGWKKNVRKNNYW